MNKGKNRNINGEKFRPVIICNDSGCHKFSSAAISDEEKKVALQRGRGDKNSLIQYSRLDYNRQVFDESARLDAKTAQVEAIAKAVLPYAFGLSVALNFALLMVPEWMTRRGYFAIGGEWILIMAAGFIAAKAAKHFQKGAR